MDARGHHALDLMLEVGIVDRLSVGREGRHQGNEDAVQVSAHECAPAGVRAGIGLTRRANRVGLNGSSLGG